MTASFHPCCLVAEDQALIGMALEAHLDEIGMAVAGPFASCEQALAWVEHATPDVALLDFKLNDGSCTTLARILRERGVPMMFYSGLPSGGPEVPDDLLDVVWIEKPADCYQLVQVLVNLTASSRAPSSAERREPESSLCGRWPIPGASRERPMERVRDHLTLPFAQSEISQ